ncbi:glycine zipper 2TM domain-containing protein [Comamonas endophytica]|uniref:Glycine zipper 2TM domain-containing protein n=1 Tax=Comamonas endophytica TaxID=2949090 RepID=A0ABY6G8B1_9BURK|nr:MULTISPECIES: glycine zipper 2TM domain-containing protein [unclassified Acidovorax]MCD2514120.1 glycine zipper 2TM domain-containing protein [Acidovorax sp. D4N7]UYG51260.1 glycine zipper 2TM domain-containing protein [Acidovorax sp. 5MLIR]
MKNMIWIGVAAALSAGAAMAQEQGRVLSVTAVQQQVAAPQQVCQDEAVPVRQRSSGAGAVLGAVVGGLAGNAIGGGMGRAAATGAGVVGGAMLGNQLEGNGETRYETVRRCTTQNFYRSQTTGYDVVYEYAGRQYTTRTATPPGDWIAVSVQPAQSQGYYATQDAYPAPAYAAPGYPPVTYSTIPQPVYTVPQERGYSAADYVAPVLIGATIAAGAHYMLRPRDRWVGPRYHHRPAPRGWRR